MKDEEIKIERNNLSFMLGVQKARSAVMTMLSEILSN